jgi:hypothetical protein
MHPVSGAVASAIATPRATSTRWLPSSGITAPGRGLAEHSPESFCDFSGPSYEQLRSAVKIEPEARSSRLRVTAGQPSVEFPRTVDMHSMV